MRLRLTFEIRLFSDYHVSSGYGFGQSVDSSLLRDYDRAPLLRGTMIAGLLRNGFYDLLSTGAASQVRTFEQQHGHSLEKRLFGLEGQPKRWSFSSARPQGGAGEESGRWASQDVTRVAINPLTRRADEHKLFTEEEGDARLHFNFTADCPTSDPRDIADGYALVAAAAMVRALGSSRRRGRGECCIVLAKAEGFPELQGQNDPARAALEAFRRTWLEPVEEQSTEVSESEIENQPEIVTGNKPLSFRVIAFLVEPVLAAKRSEAANTFETQMFIPGAVLLGALATRAAYYLGQENRQADHLFTGLFLRGQVGASNLLPAWQDEDRNTLYPSIPVPFAHAFCDFKPLSHPVVNLLDGGSADKCASCGEKMEIKKGGFVYHNGHHRTYEKSPGRMDEMHIRIDPASGRVKTGDLYQYECLSAGQYFVGELVCDGKASWEKLQEITEIRANEPFEIRLGKGTRRGYGLVRLYLQKLEGEVVSPLIDSPIEARVLNSKQPIDLLLLSDAIVPDAWGRFCSGFEPGWLAEQLDINPQDIEVERQTVANREVDAFNTHRRMPRWRDVALQAGSCARIRLLPDGIEKLTAVYREQALDSSSLDPAALALAALRWKLGQIEQRGVGLRRQEGFGRLAFNHPALLTDMSLPEAQSISLEQLPEEMKPSQQRDPLADEWTFEDEWERHLDFEQRGNEKFWQNLNGSGSAAARLIFLSQRLPITEVQQRLGELVEPDGPDEVKEFYGRTIARRSEGRKAKIDPDLVAHWKELVGELAQFTPACQAIGLKMLAERLALADKRYDHDGEGAK